MTAPKPRCPTIIVFAREPICGKTKTRLIPVLGANAAAALADAFLRDALEKIQSLNPSSLVIAGAAEPDARRSSYFLALALEFKAKLIDQGFGTLGRRMARALAPFAPDGAVLFGTDTPSLPSKNLKRAIALLDKERVVLGPSLDGGYYLVGVRGVMPDIFRGVRWGRCTVLNQTVERLRRLGLAFCLGPSWYDVDRPADLFVLAEHLRRRGAHECPRTGAVLRRLKLS